MWQTYVAHHVRVVAAESLAAPALSHALHATALGGADMPAEVARLLHRDLYACIPLGILNPAVAQILAGSEWAAILGVGLGAGSVPAPGSALHEAAKAVKAAPPLSPLQWTGLMIRYATFISTKSSAFGLALLSHTTAVLALAAEEDRRGYMGLRGVWRAADLAARLALHSGERTLEEFAVGPSPREIAKAQTTLATEAARVALASAPPSSSRGQAAGYVNTTRAAFVQRSPSGGAAAALDSAIVFCRDFRRGACHFGSACRFRHAHAPGSYNPATEQAQLGPSQPPPQAQ